MQAKNLYELISIKCKSVARDPVYGSEVITWVDFAGNIRANTNEHSGVEVVRQDQRVMIRRIEVMIRWRPGITTDMRVYTSTGRVFEIIDSIETPRHRALTMTCEELSV